MKLTPWKSSKESVARQNDPFDAFQSMFDQAVQNFFGTNTERPTLWQSDKGLNLTTFSPKINVSETENEIKVTAELPGMDEEDVNVKLDGNTLLIEGEKKHEFEEEDKEKGRHYVERSYGSFQRAVALPCEVDLEKTNAKFKKGVLNVTMAKTAEAKDKTRKIQITH